MQFRHDYINTVTAVTIFMFLDSCLPYYFTSLILLGYFMQVLCICMKKYSL